MKLRIFAMASLICCGLISTNKAMESNDVRESYKEGEEIDFRPLTTKLNYMELLRFMEYQPKTFFDALLKNFKTNDVVEISRKNKASFSLDISDPVTFVVLLQQAARQNLVDLTQLLIDTAKNKSKLSLDQYFEDALYDAMGHGAGDVVSVILDKFYERHHYGIPKIFERALCKISMTDNYDLATVLFSNERFMEALTSKDLRKVVWKALDTNASNDASRQKFRLILS